MTSRERVMRAINHQQPDRAPIDLGATRQSGIAASAYHQLKQRLNLHTPTRVVDLTQFLAEVEQPILDRFGVDAVGVFRPETNPGMPIRRENWKPWRLVRWDSRGGPGSLQSCGRAGRRVCHVP